MARVVPDVTEIMRLALGGAWMASRKDHDECAAAGARRPHGHRDPPEQHDRTKVGRPFEQRRDAAAHRAWRLHAAGRHRVGPAPVRAVTPSWLERVEGPGRNRCPSKADALRLVAQCMPHPARRRAGRPSTRSRCGSACGSSIVDPSAAAENSARRGGSAQSAMPCWHTGHCGLAGVSSVMPAEQHGAGRGLPAAAATGAATGAAAAGTRLFRSEASAGWGYRPP